jgi:uncharacterized protein
VNLLRRARWSPYVVGACIGILSWFTFAWMGHAIGVSSTAVHVAGGLESTVVPEHVTQNAYFTETFGGEALINWEFMLVVMLFVGAWLASRLGGAPRPEHVPELWAWRFGPSRPLRYTFAFVGGAILMFGARLAGGCTSGHGISGMLQLAVQSWIFTPLIFVTAMITAFLVFGREGRHHV